MSAPARGPRTLPLRRWLMIALVITILVPAITTMAVARHTLSLPAVDRFAAAAYLEDHQHEWNDPAWREEARRRYSPAGIDFILIENGQEIYRSTPDPLVDGASSHAGRFVERYEIEGDSGEPDRATIVYALVNQTAVDRFWVLPLVLIGMLTLVLTAIAWFLGRTVVRPLAATSEAAGRIAEGDLDVTLPRSRVREVSNVSHAFEGMSAALRDSLHQQAEMDQQRRMFIGAIVHDLRTPLFTLRGSLEGLDQGIANTPEKRARYVAIAREKATALDRLISDLFDYTRLGYLNQTPVREPLDLLPLVNHLVEGLTPYASAQEIEIVVEPCAAPVIVHGDGHLLTRAIENLIDNALRYTPSGGIVRISCEVESSTVTLLVSDTGPGILDVDLPNVFAPLYRGETSRNRRTGGVGLGLTIARQIFVAHGGDLVASNSTAGGAVFAGSLPRAVETLATSPTDFLFVPYPADHT